MCSKMSREQGYRLCFWLSWFVTCSYRSMKREEADLGWAWGEVQREMEPTHGLEQAFFCLLKPDRFPVHELLGSRQVLIWIWQALVIYILNLAQVCAVSFWFSLWGDFELTWEGCLKPNGVSWCVIAMSFFFFLRLVFKCRKYAVGENMDSELVLKFLARAQTGMGKTQELWSLVYLPFIFLFF